MAFDAVGWAAYRRWFSRSPGVAGGVKDGESRDPGSAGVTSPGTLLAQLLVRVVSSRTAPLRVGSAREKSPEGAGEGDCGTREGEAWDGKVDIGSEAMGTSGRKAGMEKLQLPVDREIPAARVRQSRLAGVGTEVAESSLRYRQLAQRGNPISNTICIDSNPQKSQGKNEVFRLYIYANPAYFPRSIHTISATHPATKTAVRMPAPALSPVVMGDRCWI